jgi:hypothetical protein
MAKFWLFAGIGSLFLIPALLAAPIATKADQTYWILYVVFRNGNTSLFDAPVEWFFWFEIILPLSISAFCLWKASKSGSKQN